MICPKCGREQIKPSKFCAYCGAQMDMAASTAAKAGAVGLTTKIAIGAAGVCLAAGVGAVGLHMGHNWGAGKAVVAEKESGENGDETFEEKLAGNADETSTETIDASAESDETENVDEINREAVAAYRKYVLEKKELPIENGGISAFSVIDLNNDGIFEMVVTNSSMEGSCTAYNRDTFIWYADGKIHELSLYPGVFFDLSTDRIGSSLSRTGTTELSIYQFDGKQATELGTWSANDHPEYSSVTEIRQVMQDVDKKAGTNQLNYIGVYWDVIDDNIDTYLTGKGQKTALELGSDLTSFSNVFHYTLESLQEQEAELEKEAQKAAFIAPYKAQLDAILAGTFEYSEDCVGTYSMNVKDAYESNIGIGVSWDGIEDKGDYYIIKNAELYYTPESASYGDIATLPELYVRKDGFYQYHDGYNRHSVTLQEYFSKNSYPSARWGVKFDEQGFIVSWWDGNVA